MTVKPRVLKRVVVVAFVARRFVKVEVAVEVAVMNPVVRFPTEDEEMNSLMALNIVAKRFEVVAFVMLAIVALNRVEVAFVVVELSAMKVVEAKSAVCDQMAEVVAAERVPKFVAKEKAEAPAVMQLPEISLKQPFES